MRVRATRTGMPGARRALPAIACLAVSLAATAVASGADEAFEAAIRLAGQYAAQVRSFLPLLEGPLDPKLLSAALGDVRRAVAEIDRVVAGAPALGPARADALALRQTAAAAHLQLSLYETRVFDFEGARGEVDRAREILGADAAEGFRAEWSVLQEGAPGRALLSRTRYLTLEEFEAALRALWSRARPVAFDFTSVPARDLGDLTLELSAGSPMQTPDRPPVEGGARLLRQAIASGQRTFSVPLPPGTYRLRGRPGSGLDRIFVVPETSDVDPVVLGPARFALTIEPVDRARGPRFFLNGVEVTNLGSMAYGYYRVRADQAFIKEVPERIRFIPGLGVDNRSRSTWTIFVPEGKIGVLRFGAAPLGGRLPDQDF